MAAVHDPQAPLSQQSKREGEDVAALHRGLSIFCRLRVKRSPLRQQVFWTVVPAHPGFSTQGPAGGGTPGARNLLDDAWEGWALTRTQRRVWAASTSVGWQRPAPLLEEAPAVARQAMPLALESWFLEIGAPRCQAPGLWDQHPHQRLGGSSGCFLGRFSPRFASPLEPVAS